MGLLSHNGNGQVIMIKLFCLAIALLAAVSTQAFADAFAYQADRGIITDCQLDPFTIDELEDDEAVIDLPDLFEGQSCTTLDARDVDGALVVWAEPLSNIIEEMTYSFRACVPCEPDANGFACDQQCYVLSDNARVNGFSWDGREYSMVSEGGDVYPVHWIRRETRPTAGDPVAIFQVAFQVEGRSLTALLFYRLPQ